MTVSTIWGSGSVKGGSGRKSNGREVSKFLVNGVCWAAGREADAGSGTERTHHSSGSVEHTGCRLWSMWDVCMG